MQEYPSADSDFFLTLHIPEYFKAAPWKKLCASQARSLLNQTIVVEGFFSPQAHHQLKEEQLGLSNKELDLPSLGGILADVGQATC